MGKIKIVDPGKTCGYPYPVCKKIKSKPCEQQAKLQQSYSTPMYVIKICAQILYISFDLVDYHKTPKRSQTKF